MLYSVKCYMYISGKLRQGEVFTFTKGGRLFFYPEPKVSENWFYLLLDCHAHYMDNHPKDICRAPATRHNPEEVKERIILMLYWSVEETQTMDPANLLLCWWKVHGGVGKVCLKL